MTAGPTGLDTTATPFLFCPSFNTKKCLERPGPARYPAVPL